MKNVPLDLRLYGTFFTQATIVGEEDDIQNFIPTHLDICDIVSCTVTFGKNISGGSTVYFNDVNPKQADRNKFSLEIPFRYGCIQICTFCEIVHGISDWKGVRMTLSLNMKRKVPNHFREFGDRYFKQYKEENFPKNVRIYK